MTVDGNDIPDLSRVVRYVPYGKMRKDEHDNFLGPYPSAFEERAVDNYLSITWCEYFAGLADEQLRCAVEAIRNSNMNVKAKACFCVADTSEVLNAIQGIGRLGRAIYHPEVDNDAHVGIYGIAPEEVQLLARLADEVWCDYLTKDAADALPTSECNRSANVG